MTKCVTIGPVNSGSVEFDEDLRAYLTGKGFGNQLGEHHWRKDFDDAIAADVACQTITTEIERLANKHALRLPNVFAL